MIKRAHIIAALSLALLQSVCINSAAAQRFKLGVRWAVPEDLQLASEELEGMHAAGFKAVRSDVVTSSELFALADSLGIAWYQDLPLRVLPGGRLRDTLAFARSVIADLIPFAARFESLRGIGLADLLDTSDPAACNYLMDLTEFVRERAPPTVNTFYTTRHIEKDRCRAAADEVFVDLRDASVTEIERFAGRQDSTGASGVGALGTWTDLDLDSRGLNHPRSPESQARYLERALRVLLDSEAVGVGSTVFIHRWQDPATSDDAYADMVQRRYGLHNSSGGARPALNVASGFATGDQNVFAFPAGSPAPRGWMWMTVLGWGVLTVLGVTYGTSPRFRHMVPRYFLSHAFYRDAVVSGRESLVAESIAVLFAVSVGIGMLLSILLTEVSFLPVFSVGQHWFSPEVRDFVGALLDQPWTLAVVLASAYALTAVAWTSGLSLLSRSRHTLLPAQVMMLVIWPQWPLILLLLASPAIASVDGGAKLGVAATVLLITILLFWLSVGRSLLDFRRCSRVSVGGLIAGFFLHPVVLGLAAALFATTRNGEAVAYLWNIATSN